MNPEKIVKTAQEEDLFWKILNAVVYLEVQKGHLLWKISDVARVAKVTRSLIYYYFGKSKQEIVQAALKIIGEEIFGLSPRKQDFWSQGKIADSILVTRAQLEKAPYIIIFYLNWRNKESELKKDLITLENRYLQRIKAGMPNLSLEGARALSALFLGLVSSPLIQQQDIEVACKSITALIRR